MMLSASLILISQFQFLTKFSHHSYFSVLINFIQVFDLANFQFQLSSAKISLQRVPWLVVVTELRFVFCTLSYNMENEDLKQVFRNLHPRITNDVNPDNAIDVLFSKNIISEADYYDLRHVRGSSSRCRDLLALLYRSSHPRAFIELRLALLNDYRRIVDEIDQERTSLNVQQQQTQQDHPTDGQSLYS